MNVQPVSSASHARPVQAAAPPTPPKQDADSDSKSGAVTAAKPEGAGAKVDIKA